MVEGAPGLIAVSTQLKPVSLDIFQEAIRLLTASLQVTRLGQVNTQLRNPVEEVFQLCQMQHIS